MTNKEMNIEEQIEELEEIAEKFEDNNLIDALHVINQLQEQIRALSTRDSAIGKIGQYTLREYDDHNIILERNKKVSIVKKDIFFSQLRQAKLDELFKKYNKSI